MTINLITASITTAGVATVANANTLTIIAAGAVRVSTGSSALGNSSTSDNCDVRVDGTLIAEQSAVFLATNGTTDSHSLTVGESGLLLANFGFGALVAGANAAVLNYGQIGSVVNTGVQMTGASARLENFGVIYSIAFTQGNRVWVWVVALKSFDMEFRHRTERGASFVHDMFSYFGRGFPNAIALRFYWSGSERGECGAAQFRLDHGG